MIKWIIKYNQSIAIGIVGCVIALALICTVLVLAF